MMVVTDRLLVAILLAFVSSLAATRIVRQLAVRHALLDRPNARSSHIVPTPRLGGMGILVGTAVGTAISLDGVDRFIVVAGLGGAAMTLTGLLDDLRALSPSWKYAAQVLAAGVLAVALSPSFDVSLPYLDFRVDGVGAIVVALVWVTAVVNAFNFMDGIDGIAGGVALLTAVSLVGFAAPSGGLALVALAAALAGFLLWNVQPATIFMGDGGSHLIGFALAAATLHPAGRDVPALPTLLLFAPFLFDTGFTIGRRALAGENVFTGHRGHLYQRLNSCGLAHRQVAHLYYVATVVGTIAAFLFERGGPLARLSLLVCAGVALVGYACVVGRLERRSDTRVVPSAGGA